MSVLAPLYALGALAIGLPILFHLIQRRPRGQMQFSSLMFLSPSPPRLTRRSRLDNLLLLLLRAAAIILLAAAFARPFMRSFAQLDVEQPARRIVLLVDTSASMKREGLWQQARDHAGRVLDDLHAGDQIALVTFDNHAHAQVSFESSSAESPSRRASLIKSALESAQPGWGATDVGGALTAAADMLHTVAEDAAQEGALPAQIVLITDAQRGGDLEQLRGYEWPADVRVDVKRVAPSATSNARAAVVTTAEQLPADAARGRASLPVRVFNAQDSVTQQFRLAWAAADGSLVGPREYSIHVPPGESRIVRIDRQGAPQQHLLLIGDDHSFDNEVYTAEPVQRSKTLLYVAEEARDPREDLQLYLHSAPLDNAWQKVTLERRSPEEPLVALDAETVPLIVVASPVSSDGVNSLRAYLQAGGRVLFVLGDRRSADAQVADCLEQLTLASGITVTEADIRDYAMLEQIKFAHPIFEPLAESRFNDFTRIRFWAHRHIAAEETDWEVLCRFDDKSPALIEQVVGEGRLWILAAGWQQRESQMGVSTKFVPMISQMFDPAGGRPQIKDGYFVGQAVRFPVKSGAATLSFPDGTSQQVAAEALYTLAEPGVYRLTEGQSETPIAVNVDLKESQTAPLDAEELEQHGVRLGRAMTMEEIESQRRQLRDVELEGRQKLWRWLVVGVLGILSLETVLAGWKDRQTHPPA